MTKNWNNLTKDERALYMHYQMSPSGTPYGGSGFLPEDSSDCGACSTPIFGHGWCDACYDSFTELKNKLLK